MKHLSFSILSFAELFCLDCISNENFFARTSNNKKSFSMKQIAQLSRNRTQMFCFVLWMKLYKERLNKNFVKFYDLKRRTHSFYDNVQTHMCSWEIEQKTESRVKIMRNISNFICSIFAWSRPPKRHSDRKRESERERQQQSKNSVDLFRVISCVTVRL